MAFQLALKRQRRNTNSHSETLSNKLFKNLIIPVIFFIVQKFNNTPQKFPPPLLHNTLPIVYHTLRIGNELAPVVATCSAQAGMSPRL
jgi:hypothetical protein